MYGYKLNGVVFKICLALAAAFLLYTLLITVVAAGNMESAKNIDVKCLVAGGAAIFFRSLSPALR